MPRLGSSCTHLRTDSSRQLSHLLQVIAVQFVCGFILLLCVPLRAQQGSAFTFAVSGDSRNCGDIVVPAIARRALGQGAQFYWHLGDYRAIDEFDDDILDRRLQSTDRRKLQISEYENLAWDDAIQRQLDAFGTTPVYVGIGNHETKPPKYRDNFLIEFADWLDAPVLKQQRLNDNPKDHRLKTYYHWQVAGIDFINLDNSTADQFDREQMQWIEAVLQRDRNDATVRGIVLGMHAALPDSLASGHSMNDFPVSEQTGRKVYADLLNLQRDTQKSVYILASHSHFFMADVFDTDTARRNRAVLPGWIIGTAGATRYALPEGVKQSSAAMTDVYGYLLGKVLGDGSVSFRFEQIKQEDVPPAVTSLYSKEALHFCFDENKGGH
jgi:Calcineurin-like phosphoesterase